jgi:hypothetical protein
MLLITEIANLRLSPEMHGSTRLNIPCGEQETMSRGRPFQPGNKFGRGRPKGSRNKWNLVAQRLLHEHGGLLMTKNISAGLQGDTKSRLWCLDRLMRARPPAPKLKLPPTKTLDDIAQAFDVVVNAAANNKCTDAHGVALCTMLSERRKMIETQEFAVRLEELERMAKKPGS